MTGLEARILNPAVMLTMVLAGLAYGRVLWSLNLRPTCVLWIVATAPGAIYLITVLAIRALQGTPSLIWVFLLVDWLIFSTTAFVVVLLARRRHR